GTGYLRRRLSAVPADYDDYNGGDHGRGPHRSGTERWGGGAPATWHCGCRWFAHIAGSHALHYTRGLYLFGKIAGTVCFRSGTTAPAKRTAPGPGRRRRTQSKTDGRKFRTAQGSLTGR